MKIGAITSGRKILKWQVDEEVFKTNVWNCRDNIQSLLSPHLGASVGVIAPSASYMYEIIAKALVPYQVYIIKPPDWNTFDPSTVPEPVKIYTGYYDSHPLIDWINRGIIRPEDYILIMGKDKNFHTMKNYCRVINAWMTTEGDLGFKLEWLGCNKWHVIVKSPMGVKDDEVIYEYSVGDCKCGKGGEVFQAHEQT